MNKTQRLVAVIVSAVFSFLVVLTPKTFAQTPASPDADKNTRSRQYLELINSVFGIVLQNYVDEVDPEVLYKGAMKGLMDSLEDPYTTYMEGSLQRSINDTTAGKFGGVGLSITKPNVSTPENPAYVEVANPIEGTPGWRAGIQPGDLLIEIDGQATPDISMDDVLGLLRGKIGTTVNVKVRRGKTMEFSVVLERALIEVPTVKYGMIESGINRTGYLRIIEFTPQTPERVQEALSSFKAASFTSLIIDLRNNPGGLISSVEAVADKFIDDGPVVSTKGRYPEDVSVYYASPAKTTMPKNIPIVVLINAGSASASEILSGALKDNHKAYLIGENTYGKGSVQQPLPLPYNDGIKLTIARYYSPSDINIDKVGIPPDKEVLFPTLTEEEQKAYVSMMNDNVIAEYTESHPNMTEEDISLFAEGLAKEYPLSGPLLRRMIRLSVNRTRGDMLYDLDYDVQLQAALETVCSANFSALLKETKTLRQLEEEKALQNEKNEKDIVAAKDGSAR